MKKAKIRLFNTLSRTVETFVPLSGRKVRLYTCGPTVYGRAHIGNLRAYIFADTLKRVLSRAGYRVKHVMNITDVGELSSDDETDKMLIGAKRENMTSWEVAKKYTDFFVKDCKKLNIIPPDIQCKATDHIKEQIDLVKKLEKKGFTYKTSDGIYFDTSKLKDYGKLAKLDIDGLKAGSRIDVGEKRNKTDFALWKFIKKNEKRDMIWNSPWGKGFPGWHIECSAMSMKYLGEQFDIHTGGVDHIPVHHTNEIAQSEAATGKIPFVKYWLHLEFLTLTDEKMSKSLGNIKDLDSLEKADIKPAAFRYLCLTAKYRQQLNAGDKALISAQESYNKLENMIRNIKSAVKYSNEEFPNFKLSMRGTSYIEQYNAALYDDLNTAVALAVVWTMLKDKKLPDSEKMYLLRNFDKVLGFDINSAMQKSKKQDIPSDIIKIAEKREKYRKAKNWKEADKYRSTLTDLGYNVKDTSIGYKLEHTDN